LSSTDSATTVISPLSLHDALPMISISRTRSAGAPWVKFIRKTSTPVVSRRRMRSSDAHAGPNVAMIFVRRIGGVSYITGAGVGCRESEGGAAGVEESRVEGWFN